MVNVLLVSIAAGSPSVCSHTTRAGSRVRTDPTPRAARGDCCSSPPSAGPRSRPAHRVVLGTVAAIALVQTESIGAMLAVGLVLALAGVRSGERPWHLGRPPFAAAVRAVLLVAVVLLVVSAFDRERSRVAGLRTEQHCASRHPRNRRARDLPGQPHLRRRLAAESPAGDHRHTGDQRRAHERFPGANEGFFPDVNPGTVHNAYISVLAETGLVGIVALVAAFVVVRRRLRDFAVTLDGEDRAVFDTIRLLLVVVLIWWNDDPLFGAQPETVLAAPSSACWPRTRSATATWRTRPMSPPRSTR